MSLQTPEWPQMLSSLGQLYVRGVDVDWDGFDKEYAKTRRKIVLPTYPFQRERYWIEPSQEQLSRVRPLLDKMVKSPLRKETTFETEFSRENFPFLNDHQVYDTVVSPGGCHLAMVLSAAEVMFGTPNCVLEDVIFPQALVLPFDTTRTVQVVFTPTDGATSEFQLISFDDSEQLLTHATGLLAGQYDIETPKKMPSTMMISLDDWRKNCPTEITSDSLYEAAAKQQITFGPSFRWLDRIWLGVGQAMAQLERPQAASSLLGYLVHPGLLDACLQTAGATEQESEQTRRPFALAYLHVHQQAEGRAWWCVSLMKGENKSDIYLLDENSQLLAELLDFELRLAPREAFQLAPAWEGLSRGTRDWLYRVSWQQRPYQSWLMSLIRKIG